MYLQIKRENECIHHTYLLLHTAHLLSKIKEGTADTQKMQQMNQILHQA